MEDTITIFLNNIKEKDFVVFTFAYGVISGSVKKYEKGKDQIILSDAVVYNSKMLTGVNITITNLNSAIGWGGTRTS